MRQKPNVILIVMDTARADHLSCYGYHRRTSPNIDNIARNSAVFENAFSAAPWTPPSHASIFTGKYPSHHKTLGRNVYFNKGNISLANLLSSAGYRSIGITCCNLLGRGSGFDAGFHEYVEMYNGQLLPNLNFVKHKIQDFVKTSVYGPDKNAYQATQVAKDLLKSQLKTGQSPFFLFINYFECHTPYDPPKPYKEWFCPSFDEARFFVKELLLKKILRRTSERIFDDSLDIRKLQWIAKGAGGFSFALKELPISEKEWEVVKSWYDGEILYLDSQIGNLVDFLIDNDIFDETCLIITSDHGENFGEHGLAVHPLCVYDSLLHVPLIISYPSLISEGRRISNLASTIDVFPTVAHLLNIKGFTENIQGKNLYPFEDRKIHDFICAEYGGLHRETFERNSKLNRIDKGSKCIRNLTFKYIFSAEKKELYCIRDDPFEQENVLHEYPEQAKFLRKQLRKFVDLSYFGPQDFLHSQKMVHRLRALGYM